MCDINIVYLYPNSLILRFYSIFLDASRVQFYTAQCNLKQNTTLEGQKLAFKLYT